MDLFLSFLTRILGEDHPLVARLADIEATPADEITAALEGAPEDQRDVLAAFYDLSDADLAEIDTAMRELAADEDASTADLADALETAEMIRGVAAVRMEAAEAEQAERDRIREQLSADAPEPRPLPILIPKCSPPSWRV